MVISKCTGKMLEGFKRENDMIQFLLLKKKISAYCGEKGQVDTRRTVKPILQSYHQQMTLD